MYSIPNGADVEPHERAKLLREGLLPGMQDLVILKDGAQCLYCEMKKRNGSEREKQATIRGIMAEMGFTCVVCKGAKEAVKAIKDWYYV